ncbi:uncharacterized protein LOC119840057 [Zerene cesonia]|uniref:uncharacterized protein LOC119840057 n=1 Tax=Zerene cesonia TaxID=33412 RepID=UPI0018E57387|nr:uncharacterized protein LOC119840057 [Zerene cesonia]
MWQFILYAALAISVSGHGRVLQPAGRASMWRMGFNSRHNYDDDGLNCGGFYRQYGTNKGKCGICGDAYNLARPRPHELGGEYGRGTIVDTYESGQIIEVTVEITAYHKGYWYFKICPQPEKEAYQKCFDQYPLELEDGGELYFPPKGGKFTLKYRLPKGLSCKHCIMQWRYVAGNNWGFCKNGTQGLGCGDQETFGACSDVSITPVKHTDVESKPMELAFAGLYKLLQKSNVAPYITKPKRKHPFRKKNHRKPRSKSKSKKRKKAKRNDAWLSHWL